MKPRNNWKKEYEKLLDLYNVMHVTCQQTCDDLRVEVARIAYENQALKEKIWRINETT